MSQDPNDEPASELLKRITAEKARLVKAGEIITKAPDPSGKPVEQDFLTPANWTIAKLADISNIVMGQSPQGETYNTYREGVPLINGPVEFSEGPFGKTVINQYTTAPTNFCNKGDFLICVRGSTTGRTNIAGFGACIGRGVAAIQPVFDDDFVRFFLWSMRKRIISMGRGAAFPSITRKQLETLPVPVPPLAEQHRIVAKVDELMALCDRLEAARAEREATRDRLATASLDRLNTPDPDPTTFQHDVAFALNNLTPLTTRPDQVKALRQTILNLAARGKLVPQDPNDEPASELLKRISAEKARLVKAGEIKKVKPQLLILPDVPFNPPVGWAWSTVGGICSKTGSGSTPRGGKSTYREKGIVFLRSQNVYDDGLRLHDVAYIDEATHAKMSGTVVRPADLLLNITGGSIGRCCRVPDDFDEANVSQHVAIIRIAINGLQDFVHALILSPYFQSFIFEEQTGAGRGGLPKNKMDRIPIALPPLPEQHRIVGKVDELMALCDRLEASLTMGDDTLGRLIGALLHEALELLENGEAAA